MTPYMSGEFMVVTIKRTNISEVVLDVAGVQSATDAEVQKLLGMNSKATGYADKWYKAKLNFIVLDEKTGKEKRTPLHLLVNAGSNNAAHELVITHMKGSLSDYEIADIVETKIMDAFFYDDSRLKQEKETRDDAHKIQKLSEKLASDRKIQKHVKAFHDAVPDGMKVSMVHDGKETVLVDKSDKPDKPDGDDIRGDD